MDDENHIDALNRSRRSFFSHESSRSRKTIHGFDEKDNMLIETDSETGVWNANRITYNVTPQFDNFNTTITLNEKELVSNPLFEKILMGMSLHSHEGYFHQVNRFLCQMLGYSSSELSTKHIAEVVIKKDREAISKLLTQSNPASVKNIKMTTHALHKNNYRISVIIYRTPIVSKNEYGSHYLLQWLPTSVHSVAIRDYQYDREELLKEIHHRVKNNLQIILSLLNLQSRHVKDSRDIDLFKTSQDRIHSMALVHEKLYDSKNFKKIEMDDYVGSLFQSLKRTYYPLAKDIGIEIHMKGIYLPVDIAIPCGLILNELLSNAMKHAFLNMTRKKKKIVASFNEIGENLIELKIWDNGIGLPKDFRLNEQTSLGLSLVSYIAQDQLRGCFKFSKRKIGTEASIQFQMCMENS